jgi:hypothetical protein
MEKGLFDLSHFDFDPNLFLDLSRKRGARVFILLDLAAGKFPVPFHPTPGGALGDEVLAVTLNETRYNPKHGE